MRPLQPREDTIAQEPLALFQGLLLLDLQIGCCNDGALCREFVLREARERAGRHEPFFENQAE